MAKPKSSTILLVSQSESVERERLKAIRAIQNSKIKYKTLLRVSSRNVAKAMLNIRL